MVAWSFDDYLKIETFFGEHWSCSRLLRSIDCWWLEKRLTGCWWACGPNFRGQLKKLAAEKSKRVLQFVCKKVHMWEMTKEKRALLIWNWAKIKLSGSKCDLSCCCCYLTLLSLYLGWDIIGYESDPLPPFR